MPQYLVLNLRDCTATQLVALGTAGYRLIGSNGVEAFFARQGTVSFESPRADAMIEKGEGG